MRVGDHRDMDLTLPRIQQTGEDGATAAAGSDN